jgi:hypothetical protein
VSPVIERITRPTVTGDGRKAPALRFGDLRVQTLAGAMLFTVTGITNKTLRGLMTGLLNRPYSMNQASCDLSRSARNSLIARFPDRNRHTLTPDGLLFACFYTSVPAAHQLRTHLRVRSRTNWAMPTSSYGSTAKSASASAGTPGSPKPVQHTQARHLAPDPAAERGSHATARPPHVVTCLHEFVQ